MEYILIIKSLLDSLLNSLFSPLFGLLIKLIGRLNNTFKCFEWLNKKRKFYESDSKSLYRILDHIIKNNVIDGNHHYYYKIDRKYTSNLGWYNLSKWYSRLLEKFYETDGGNANRLFHHHEITNNEFNAEIQNPQSQYLHIVSGDSYCNNPFNKYHYTHILINNIIINIELYTNNDLYNDIYSNVELVKITPLCIVDKQVIVERYNSFYNNVLVNQNGQNANIMIRYINDNWEIPVAPDAFIDPNIQNLNNYFDYVLKTKYTRSDDINTRQFIGQFIKCSYNPLIRALYIGHNCRYNDTFNGVINFIPKHV